MSRETDRFKVPSPTLAVSVKEPVPVPVTVAFELLNLAPLPLNDQVTHELSMSVIARELLPQG